MEQFVGEEFDAVISSVTDFGIFVELPSSIEGMIPMTGIKGRFLRVRGGLPAAARGAYGKKPLRSATKSASSSYGRTCVCGGLILLSRAWHIAIKRRPPRNIRMKRKEEKARGQKAVPFLCEKENEEKDKNNPHLRVIFISGLISFCHLKLSHRIIAV